MPETDLSIKTALIAGIDPGAGTNVLDADDGKFLNDGRTILKVVNGAAGDRDVIFVTPITVGTQSLAVADHTVTLGNTQTRYIGPFPVSIYSLISDEERIALATLGAVTVRRPGAALNLIRAHLPV